MTRNPDWNMSQESILPVLIQFSSIAAISLFGVERRQPFWTRPELSSQKHALAPLDLDVLESGDGSDMSWCAVRRP
jgi:hypothetical protein